MKRSVQLLIKQSEQSNDLVALGIGRQVIRESRKERFEEDWLATFQDKLGKENIAYSAKKGCWTITVNLEIYEFYPKANKVFAKKKNKWIKPGLKWLINTFINV